MAARRRLDAELVRRGLATTRTEAQAAVAAGRVTVAGAPATVTRPADKPARLVAPGEPVRVLGDGPRFVGRGGDKLDAALTQFGLDPTGMRVLDAGASTGGFTDCLLQRGAAEVVAVDVGHGQLHARLRSDPRVRVHERVNVRHLKPEAIGGTVDAAVADLSFISLRAVLGPLTEAVAPGGWLVLLVKPQFEAGRAEVSRGRGVIRDPAVHDRVRQEIDDSLRAHGSIIMGWMESPLRGADGNVEYLVAARRPTSEAGA